MDIAYLQCDLRYDPYLLEVFGGGMWFNILLTE